VQRKQHSLKDGENMDKELKITFELNTANGTLKIDIVGDNLNNTVNRAQDFLNTLKDKGYSAFIQ
jgi:hypothetical protein